jgi:biotin transport system substrate-specific component
MYSLTRAGTDRAVYAVWLRAAGVVCFALLTAAAAKICVWSGPVPITMQTAAVLLAGLVLGPAAGAGSQALYLAMGVCGLPVFAGGLAGPAYLFGPTGGYLIAFVPAALVAGMIAGSQAWSMTRLVLGVGAGTALIFAGGISWLAATGLGLPDALAAGCWPFVPGAVVKAMMVIVAARMIRLRCPGQTGA